MAPRHIDGTISSHVEAVQFSPAIGVNRAPRHINGTISSHVEAVKFFPPKSVNRAPRYVNGTISSHVEAGEKKEQTNPDFYDQPALMLEIATG